MAPRPEHRRHGYDQEAARVVAKAYANPKTKCRRCGRTLAEHPPTKTGKPPSWDAGHVHDGVPGSLLLPEVAGCNRSAGASAGNRARKGITPTRNWGQRTRR